MSEMQREYEMLRDFNVSLANAIVDAYQRAQDTGAAFEFAATNCAKALRAARRMYQ